MLKLDIDTRNIARLTLNRPEVHNAFNAELIVELSQALDEIGNTGNLRALILAGEGKSFSAGADMNWMQGMARATEQENQADAASLAAMLRKLDELPCPTIARVHGAAMGGGVGLVACCDIVVAATAARFALSEVRLGLIPATIAPFVIGKIGAGNARRWMLTGERFDGRQARDMGLVNEVREPADLDDTLEELLQTLLAAGPFAVTECKKLIRTLTGSRESNDVIDTMTADWIARLRVSDEGQEGLGAFLEKRPPEWTN